MRPPSRVGVSEPRGFGLGLTMLTASCCDSAANAEQHLADLGAEVTPNALPTSAKALSWLNWRVCRWSFVRDLGW